MKFQLYGRYFDKCKRSMVDSRNTTGQKRTSRIRSGVEFSENFATVTPREHGDVGLEIDRIGCESAKNLG